MKLLVAEAPPDAHKVLSEVKLYSGWVRVGLIVALGVGLWAAIVFGVLAALHR
jgi:hypothetical protein